MSGIRAGFFNHDDNRKIGVARWMLDSTRDDDGDANPTVALVLAQIVWWCGLDTKTHRPHSGHEHGGERWLVRDDDSEEWQKELGLGARTVRRCRLRLVKLGLIESRVLVDGGLRCSHLRPLPVADEAENDTESEPSTIRPKAHIDPSEEADDTKSIDGSGRMPEALLAESHARASIRSKEREKTKSKKLPPADADEARSLVEKFWEWHKTERGVTPTLTANGKGNAFMALVGIAKHFLDAGYPAGRVKRALRDVPTFSINAVTLALNQQPEARRPPSRPPTGPRADVESLWDRNEPTEVITW